MPAQNFEDVMMKITCAKMARDALAYCAQQDTPHHPSWRTIDQVLEGTHLVRIARNGYIDVVVQR